MTPVEAITLCRFVQACCPNQALDELTPDAWGLILEDVPFSDAKDAAIRLARVQRYIAASDIFEAVREIQNKRLRRAGGFGMTPREFCDDYRLSEAYRTTWSHEIKYGADVATAEAAAYAKADETLRALTQGPQLAVNQEQFHETGEAV